MRLLLLYSSIIFILLGISNLSAAQDSTDVISRIAGFPSGLLSKINKKSADLDKRLTRQTEKYLRKLGRSENKLKKKLYRLDSAAAKDFFSYDAASYYQLLAAKLKNDSVTHGIVSGEYTPYIDSIKGSLTFLKNNPGLVTASKILPSDITGSLNRVKQLESKMQTADMIKQLIQQRKEQIKNYLLRYTKLPAGITSIYHDYSKQYYYYNQQVNEYKNILNDPDKMLKTALVLLNKLPVFKAFMQKYSMLAGLFPNPGNSTASASVQGLAAREQVSSFIQARLGEAGPGATSLLQQNIQSAQGQLDQLRNKLNENGGGDLDMPEFRPNTQKSKSILKRLEYGTNLQTTRSTYFFPVTTDFGLSVGYKLDDKNIIGVGASYKVGWGQDFKHIAISNQGIGFRSFADINIKKSFFASGGFEYNYQQPFYSADILHHLDSWQQSGLIGLSKIVSLKTKLFKKTKIQLLWDFLSYQQVPRAQPFKFRVGYNF